MTKKKNILMDNKMTFIKDVSKGDLRQTLKVKHLRWLAEKTDNQGGNYMKLYSEKISFK